jgi:hypothetical protein
MSKLSKIRIVSFKYERHSHGLDEVLVIKMETAPFKSCIFSLFKLFSFQFDNETGYEGGGITRVLYAFRYAKCVAS